VERWTISLNGHVPDFHKYTMTKSPENEAIDNTHLLRTGVSGMAFICSQPHRFMLQVVALVSRQQGLWEAVDLALRVCRPFTSGPCSYLVKGSTAALVADGQLI
jgi:hypothetical protein